MAPSDIDPGVQAGIPRENTTTIFIRHFQQKLRAEIEASEDGKFPERSILAFVTSALDMYEILTAEQRQTLTSLGTIYSEKPLVPFFASPDEGSAQVHSTEIRLLMFDRIEAGRPLRCSMRIWDIGISNSYANLGDEILEDLYFALSYRWTESPKNSILIIDGHPTTISEDLDAAIRSVSNACTSKEETGQFILWIDTICINQSDGKERSQQVAMMAYIYRYCRACFVWLGQASDGSEHFQDLMHTFTSTVTKQPDSETLDNTLHQIRIAQEQRKAATAFFSRSYWERLWVVQEVLLSRRKVILCGTHAWNWDVVRLFLKYLKVCSSQDLALKIQRYGQAAFDLIEMDRHFESLNRTPSLSLLEGLLISQGRKSSDMRDAVYAILGLTLPNGLRPNYLKSANNVWIQATCMIIKEEKSLNVLSMANVIDPDTRKKYWAVKKRFLVELFRNRTTPFEGVIDPDLLRWLGYDVEKFMHDYRRIISMNIPNHEFSIRLQMLWCPLDLCEVTALPTWVADWSGNRSLNSHILYAIENGKVRKREFNAAPDDAANWADSTWRKFGEELPINLGTTLRLSVDAYLVDTINFVQASHKRGDVLDTWYEWDRHLTLMKAPPYDSRESRANAFVNALWLEEGHRGERRKDSKHFQRVSLSRCFLEDVPRAKSVSSEPISGQNRSAVPEDKGQQFRPPVLAFVGAEGDDTEINHAESREMTLWLETLHSHFLVFFTTQGYLGLGGKGITPGDNVYIVPGCDVPLVLRKCLSSHKQSMRLKSTKNSRREYLKDIAGELSGGGVSRTGLKVAETDFEQEVNDNDHWLLSECYVDGIMHGEFFSDNSKRKECKKFVSIV